MHLVFDLPKPDLFLLQTSIIKNHHLLKHFWIMDRENTAPENAISNDLLHTGIDGENYGNPSDKLRPDESSPPPPPSLGTSARNRARSFAPENQGNSTSTNAVVSIKSKLSFVLPNKFLVWSSKTALELSYYHCEEKCQGTKTLQLHK